MYKLYYYYKIYYDNYIEYTAIDLQELLYQLRYFQYNFGECKYKVYKKINNKYKRIKL